MIWNMWEFWLGVAVIQTIGLYAYRKGIKRGRADLSRELQAGPEWIKKHSRS